ncbi:MAG TPA: FkbM family methyltransferase, partial [Thermoanaerobaculia bacterium]
YPGSRIFAFEPAPPLFAVLSANATWCEGEVLLFNCGLSRDAGTALLTFYPQSSGMSSFYPAAEEEKAALKTLFHNELTRGDKPGADQLLRYEDELVEQRFKSEPWTCPLRTLSQVIAEHAVDEIDLLKIDVEKSELDVLAGLAARDWPKVRQAVVEVHDLPGRIAQVQELFAAHGFAVQVEQDDLYHGSARSNLYALRKSGGYPPRTKKATRGRAWLLPRIASNEPPERGGSGNRYGVQAVTVTSSRNQPVDVVEQSVIVVNPMCTVLPAQPPVVPVALQAASKSIVVFVIVDDAPVKTAAPAAPAGGQEAAMVPL